MAEAGHVITCRPALDKKYFKLDAMVVRAKIKLARTDGSIM
jgi:hypothetical protein